MSEFDKKISALTSGSDSQAADEYVIARGGSNYKITGANIAAAATKLGTIATGVWQGTAIADTYLATISTAGKVSNSATTATSANTASAIVARDASGNFTAGTITATLSGAAPAGSLSGTTLASGVTASSLTSVGTLSSLTVSGNTNLATTSGKVGIGTASPSGVLDIRGSGTSGDNNAFLRWAADSAGYAPGFNIYKARGTIASPTVVSSGDQLGVVLFGGYDGSAYQNAAYIESRVDGTPGAGDMPGRLGFYTTADGSSTPTERMRLDASGNLGLGVTPSASWSGRRAFQFGLTGVAYAHTADTPVGFATNAYYNGSVWKAIETSPARRLELSDAGFAWHIAPSANQNADLTFTQAMTLDASGNLGVGTASPSSTFGFSQVLELAGTTAALVLNPSNTTSGSGIEVKGASPLRFTINNTERARITSGGDFLVGGITSTISSAKVAIKGNADRNVQLVLANSAETYGRIQFSSNGNYYIGGGQYGADWTAGSNVDMAFNVNIGATPATATLSTAGVWTNASDSRYKENIVASPYGLNEVLQLKPSQYNIIGNDAKQIGLIAQDVLTVIPEVVDSVYCEPLNENRYTLSYGNLVAVLVKAIQELEARIATLEAGA